MHNLLSKSIATLIGIVFFAGGAYVALAGPQPQPGPPAATAAQQPATGTTAAAQPGAYIFRYQTQPRIGSNGPITPVSQSTLQGCQNALANILTAGDILVNIAIIQPCTFVAGASAPTIDAVLSPAAQNAAGNPDLRGLICDITNGWAVDGGTFAACIPVAIYYVIYKPFSWLLIGAGYIFDFTLALSIDKYFVDQPFVASSWTIVRDFSNMVFIFILLYTGISTMFGMGNWKRAVIHVVIIALFINFSLFFTKVVIDAGNILAVGIYSSMGAPKPASEAHLSNPSPGFQERNISENLVNAFKPESFILAAGGLSDPINATIIFIIAAIVNGFAAYVFFKAALLFIGRLIAFWLLMIVSPFAFISWAFPSGNKFQQWFDMLLAQAFVAPIFLFLVYLIMQLVNSGGAGILSSFVSSSGGTGGGFTFNTIIGPVIVATILIVALHKALKFTSKMADELGELGAKLGAGALGAAVAAPSLGGAVAGGALRGVGGLASYAASKGLGGGAGGRLDKFGKGTQSAGRGVAAAGSALNLHNLPKNLSKIPVVGKAAGAVTKAGIGTLGIPDYTKALKGGDEGKAAAKAEKAMADKVATLDKFKTSVGLPVGDKRGLTDPAVDDIILAKKNALETAAAKAEIDLEDVKRMLPNDAGAQAMAVIGKRRAERDFQEFTQKHTKAKEIEKELKDAND